MGIRVGPAFDDLEIVQDVPFDPLQRSYSTYSSTTVDDDEHNE